MKYALLLLLAGCATQPAWHKDGGDADSLYRDNGYCRNQSVAVAGISLVTESVYRNCMASKGWHP